MSRPARYTVGQVAASLQVSPDHVRTLIRKGELAAVNTSAGDGRPTLRIAA